MTQIGSRMVREGPRAGLEGHSVGNPSIGDQDRNFDTPPGARLAFKKVGRTLTA